MKKLLISAVTILVTLTLTGCMRLGKVGYISPAPNDKNEVKEEVIKLQFSVSGTDVYGGINRELVDQKLDDLKNVDIEYGGEAKSLFAQPIPFLVIKYLK